jgi:hypothetical protein
MRYDGPSEGQAALSRVRAIRRWNAKTPSDPARGFPKAIGRVQKQTGDSWPETEAQANFRFPRPCRRASSLESFRLRRGFLSSEFIPSQPLADCLSHGNTKALRIAHRFSILKLAVVIAKRLFVDVPEQMKRFDAHIGATEAALQQTPEVLPSVSVNIAANVLSAWLIT